VADGTVVGIHYDPMLAKVIAWAPTRPQAAARLAAALAGARIHGVVTNRDLLVNVLRHPAFLDGATDTAFFDRHGVDTLAARAGADDPDAALAAALALDAARPRRLKGVSSGWRNVVSQPQRVSFDEAEVEFRFGRCGLEPDGPQLVSATPGQVVLERSGIRRAYQIAAYGDDVYVDWAGGSRHLRSLPRFVDPTTQPAAGSLIAPMPGTVVRLAVAVGDSVKAGDPVLWLEAMKMQHRIDAPADGVVAELPVKEGQQIEVGAVLAVVEEEGSELP
jgi:propionyl-CoA carboxylase alpha chain